jgi:hypothetical protein
MGGFDPQCEEVRIGAAHENVLPEYDFARIKGGIRGKYSEAYCEGHTVEIRQTDGTTSVQYFQLEDGAVMLEPDVRKYFPDSEAVNRALRALIAIAPKKTLRLPRGQQVSAPDLLCWDTATRRGRGGRGADDRDDGGAK